MICKRSLSSHTSATVSQRRSDKVSSHTLVTPSPHGDGAIAPTLTIHASSLCRSLGVTSGIGLKPIKISPWRYIEGCKGQLCLGIVVYCLVEHCPREFGGQGGS
jgi:hypothetical protein